MAYNYADVLESYMIEPAEEARISDDKSYDRITGGGTKESTPINFAKVLIGKAKLEKACKVFVSDNNINENCIFTLKVWDQDTLRKLKPIIAKIDNAFKLKHSIDEDDDKTYIEFYKDGK